MGQCPTSLHASAHRFEARSETWAAFLCRLPTAFGVGTGRDVGQCPTLLETRASAAYKLMIAHPCPFCDRPIAEFRILLQPLRNQLGTPRSGLIARFG